MTTYPVELSGGFSGLSTGQIQGIAKAPFTGHFLNAPMLGDRRPKTLVASTGAWYFDNAPHGDYSGTEQGGTGGPAAMQFSPTGTEGVVTIGRVRTANSTTSFTGEQSISYNHTKYTYKLRVLNTHGAPVTGASADWTASSRTIAKTGGFASYTYTGWDMVYITAGGTKGWYRIQSKTDNNSIVLTDDASILSSTNLTGTVNFEVYPCNFATYITGATWTEATNTISKTGAFSSYTAGTDDVVLIKSGTGTIGWESWCKVSSKTNNNEIVLAEDGIADDAANDIELILFKRPSYEERIVDPTLGVDPASGPSPTTTITVTSAFTNQPRVGDLYYLYVYEVDGVEAAVGSPGEGPLTVPTNDPESVPTATAAGTAYCPWPANTFSSQVRMSVQGNQGLCTLPESRDKTQMHAAWWGLFTMPKETLIYGDRLNINFSGGYDYNGTPFIFEVAIIPNFDPETDWEKLYDTNSENRLTNKAVWFQTDPIYHTGSAARDISFNFECQTGGFTRGAGAIAQYVHNWTMTLDIASGTSVTSPYTAPTQQKRYYTKTFVASDLDLHNVDTRWTILVKTEHPSMKGKPGYHGHYFGEPFSATTGNGGGVWLHHTGTVTAAATGISVKLPLAPRSRFTNFNVTYYPNGSY